MADDVEAFLREFAPEDVLATVLWLLDNGYALSDRQPETGLGTFGASLVYVGDAVVTVTVDRSQWFLDVARGPGARSDDFDLLVAAYEGRPYWECFSAAAQQDRQGPLPRQLPPGVSWRESLPVVLAWLAPGGDGIVAAVGLARDQRFAVMWPDAAETRRLLRAWRDERRPIP